MDHILKLQGLKDLTYRKGRACNISSIFLWANYYMPILAIDVLKPGLRCGTEFSLFLGRHHSFPRDFSCQYHLDQAFIFRYFFSLSLAVIKFLTSCNIAHRSCSLYKAEILETSTAMTSSTAEISAQHTHFLLYRTHTRTAKI
jgi:hypothetical protein